MAVCAALTALVMGFPAARGAQAASVSVPDDVGALGVPLMLSLKTTGRLLPAGGRLVRLYLEQQPLGQVLTGADGYGFLKHTPAAPGLFHLRALMDGVEGTGRILVAAPEDKVLLVEVTAALGLSRLDRGVRDEAAAVLRVLAPRYPIVYLAGRMAGDIARQWIAAGDAPSAVVVESTPSRLVHRLAARKVPLWAVIGSPDLAAAASAVPVRLTLVPADTGTRIKRWEDVPAHLEKGARK
jgi:hypothetical protein